MYVFDLSTKEISDFEVDGTFVHNSVFSISADNEGCLWIGSSTGVYCYKEGKRIRHFDCKNSSLPEGNVYVVFFDSSHKGWFGTQNGIGIWDPMSESVRKDVFPENFADGERIVSVYEDSRHMLYFIPHKGNVFTSDVSMNHFRRLGGDTPLEGKDVMFITEDRDSCLWIGTNDGLFYYDKREGFVLYNFVDGIPSSNFCPVFLLRTAKVRCGWATIRGWFLFRQRGKNRSLACLMLWAFPMYI